MSESFDPRVTPWHIDDSEFYGLESFDDHMRFLLQYSFLNQPVAVDTLRDRVRALAGASQPAQLLIRIGSAPPVEEAMPRRPLECVVARAE